MTTKTHFILATIVAMTLSMQLHSQILFDYTGDEDGVAEAVAAGLIFDILDEVNGPIHSEVWCSSGLGSTNWELSDGPFNTGFSAMQIVLIPESCRSMTVTSFQFTIRRDAAGPQLNRMAYSIDGGVTWVDAGSDFATNANPCEVVEVYNWDVPDFTTTSTLIFRIYGWNADNSAGQQHLLDGFISGTTSFVGPFTYYADVDADGYGNAGSTTTACSAPVGYVANSLDCDDANSGIKPGATEICNSIDDDCNGTADDGLTFTNYYADNDGDTYGDPATSISTCDGAPVGYITDNTDCDDDVAVINPTTVWYADADADGYYTGPGITQCVYPGPGYYFDGFAGGGDCNDADPAINPGATEICGNAIDENCDGYIEALAVYANIFSENPVCKPNSVILGASPSGVGNTYQWYRNGTIIPGATSENLNVTALRGHYQVMVSNGSCTEISDSVFVRIYNPNDPVINYATTDLCVTNPIKLKATFGFAPDHSYQWYKNDILIPGATSAKYNATEAGVYTVNVYADFLGCNFWSAGVELSEACRLDADYTNLKASIYPNPNNGTFVMSLNSALSIQEATVQITNLLGEVVYSTVISASTTQLALSIPSPAAGIYTATIISGDTHTQLQFVVQ
ncbi:MAG TPA: MopE-related protein [Chitinophagales bacterium]|nr:MopE-related protein [Chitinophagales bacterium]